jgi:hypothetical protein
VKAIASVVGTRSATQVRTHAQKYFMKLARSQTKEEAALGKGGSNPDQEPSEAVSFSPSFFFFFPCAHPRLFLC